MQYVTAQTPWTSQRQTIRRLSRDCGVPAWLRSQSSPSHLEKQPGLSLAPTSVSSGCRVIAGVVSGAVTVCDGAPLRSRRGKGRARSPRAHIVAGVATPKTTWRRGCATTAAHRWSASCPRGNPTTTTWRGSACPMRRRGGASRVSRLAYTCQYSTRPPRASRHAA